MQFIPKQPNEPADWNLWFTRADNGLRSYDYGRDVSVLHNLRNAKRYLVEEQHGLCAYCQKDMLPDGVITDDALNRISLEHLIPKEYNKSVSTSYHNLVAVCNDPQVGEKYCENARGSKVLTTLVLHSNCSVSATANHCYFAAYSDGQVLPKERLTSEIQKQVEAFISTLNLNHPLLKDRRKSDALAGWIDASKNIPVNRRSGYWRSRFESVWRNERQQYRQFLLAYLSTKCGRN